MHLTPLIVLALIMLTALESGGASTGAGDAEAELQEESAVVPSQGLGSQDRRSRVGIRRGQQDLQTVRGGGRVIVEQPHPLGGLDIEGLIGI